MPALSSIGRALSFKRSNGNGNGNGNGRSNGGSRAPSQPGSARSQRSQVSLHQHSPCLTHALQLPAGNPCSAAG